MAKIRTLKKDINYVLGDLLQAIYIHEMTTTGKPTEATNALIDEALESFDSLMEKVNAKNITNKKAHFNQINKDLEETANQLVTKINAL